MLKSYNGSKINSYPFGQLDNWVTIPTIQQLTLKVIEVKIMGQVKVQGHIPAVTMTLTGLRIHAHEKSEQDW